MALSQNSILEGIDNLPIYKRDYEVISDLLNMDDPKFFTKILEEVLNGNLYWSDFDKYLSYTEYQSLVSKNLEIQEKVKNTMSLLSTFRQTMDSSFSGFSNETTTIGYNQGSKDTDLKGYNLYNKEYDHIRNNLIYELTKIKDNDNEISVAFKYKLSNCIRNGQILLSKVKSENGLESSITYDAGKGEIYSGENTYEYINPDDIFFYINNYIIPIEYEYQVIDERDRIYMARNSITEIEMKQFKSLAYFLRRGKFYESGE